MIKTGIETGVLGCGLIRPTSGIVITKNIYTRYSDLDAKAFLYTSTASGNQIKDAIYGLVKDLKLANIWSRCLAIYPFVGGTSTTMRYNLADTTQYNITFNGGATFSSTGYLPNGSTGFANTGLNASARLTTNNNHLSFYSRTNNTTAGGCSIGAITGGSGSYSSPMISIQAKIASTNQTIMQNGSGATAETATFTNTDGKGFYVNCRVSAAIGGTIGYKNGVQQAANTIASTVSTYPNKTILIGVFDAVGSVGGADNKECAFASIGLSLTAAQVADYNTIVTNFQTALSRNV